MGSARSFQGIAATFLALAVSASAQTSPAPPTSPSIGEAIDSQVSLVERQVVAAVEAMPESKYDFTPENAGIKGANFKGVYTFAGLVRHLAATNYLLWSGTVGEPPPANVKSIQGPPELKSKAELVQFLKDSFALGHRAAKGLTTANATDMIPGMRAGPSPRIFIVTFVLTHAFDEYGQMEEYLRMNGIVPPASA